MNLLDRYVIRAVLGGVFVVLAVLLALGALFTFAGQQDDIGEGTYTALDALWFVLLNIPQQMYETMPIAVMIGALLGLGSLARGSELTVMRAAGISVWRIAGSVTMAGLLLVFLAVLCGEFLAPPLQAMAKQQKLLAKFSTITFAGRAGPWVRDGNLLINVSQQSGRGEFGGMRIFELTEDHDLKSVAHGDHGERAGRRQLETLALRQHDVRRRTHRVAARRTAASSPPRWAATSWR